MPKRWLALAALLLLGANGYVYAAILAPGGVRIVPLSVGQGGSAMLVTLPEGHAVLVNAGGDASTVRALGEALPPWQRHLDALVLTSGAGGAAGGAPFVLARYAVGAVLTSGAGTPAREAVLASAASAASVAVQKIPPGAGAVLHCGGRTLDLAALARAKTK